MGKSVRSKKEVVSIDEVREDFAETPVEGESEAVTETPGAEDGAPEDATAVETPRDESEDRPLHLRVEVCDPEDAIKEVKDVMSLRVRLSDEELVEFSDEMIEAMDDAKRARSRLKGYQAECKQEEEEALQRAEEAKCKLRSKHEDRHVDCVQIHNFTRGKVYTIRLDTGELVQERGMQPWERQADITEVTGDAAEVEQQGDSDDLGEMEIEFEDDDQAEAGELVGVGAGEDDGEGEV